MLPTDPIATHFTWKDALWLPSWGRMGTVEDGFSEVVGANLVLIFQLMDQVRDYFALPIRVHVAWRPDKYNALVKGAPNSAHLATGTNEAACDFDVMGISCDEARKKIIQDGKLDQWKMRMEDNGIGAPWIHLDTRQPPPGHPRFFKP